MRCKVSLLIFLLVPNVLFPSESGSLQDVPLFDENESNAEEIDNSECCCFSNMLRFLVCIGCRETEQQKEERRKLIESKKQLTQAPHFSGKEINRMASGKFAFNPQDPPARANPQHSTYRATGDETVVSV